MWNCSDSDLRFGHLSPRLLKALVLFHWKPKNPRGTYRKGVCDTMLMPQRSNSKGHLRPKTAQKGSNLPRACSSIPLAPVLFLQTLGPCFVPPCPCYDGNCTAQVRCRKPPFTNSHFRFPILDGVEPFNQGPVDRGFQTVVRDCRPE